MSYELGITDLCSGEEREGNTDREVIVKATVTQKKGCIASLMSH